VSVALPPLYDRWIAALLGQSLEDEPRATCLDCAMLPGAGHELDGPPFNAATKCCTFEPGLPNFVVGGVLSDGDTPAARLLRQRIAGGAGVTPLGMLAPATHRVLYSEATRSPTPFGRVAALRCGFLADGLCGIHRHRNAICSTWFCKYERGALGKVMWSALKEVLKLCERALARHCVLELGLSTGALLRLAAQESEVPRTADQHDLDGIADPERQRLVWGNFYGREVELFQRAAAIVDKLSWDDVLALGGVELAARVQLFVRLRRRLSRMPAQVLRGTSGLVQLSPTPGRARLRNATLLNDWADIPAAALPDVGRVLGKPLADALADLARAGSAVDASVVRALLDYQLLVAAPDAYGDE
jgi:hypothetical protein